MIVLLLSLFSLTKAQIWGTYKPNLYFCLKDISDAKKPEHISLAWIVEDWKTGIPLVRHRVQEQSYEKVHSYFDYHDGHDNAIETIEDPDYNTKFIISWT
jgi:Glycosyl hydrolase family 63 N-terminal domain